MIKKTKYRLRRWEANNLTSYRQRLHWRVGSWLFLAQVDLEISLDYPESYRKDVSAAIARLNRIDKLVGRRRISL